MCCLSLVLRLSPPPARHKNILDPIKCLLSLDQTTLTTQCCVLFLIVLTLNIHQDIHTHKHTSQYMKLISKSNLSHLDFALNIQLTSTAVLQQ